MATTPSLLLPYIMPAQAQKHVTHNEAMTLLDTLVQLSVLDKDLTAPPGAPDEGDCYIVAGGGGTATDAWVGWETRIARYIDGEWRSYLPGEGGGAGWLAWVQDEDAMYRFDGADWTLAGIEGPQGPQGPAYQPDAAVDAIAGRAAYDGEDAAFSVLVVSDAGNSGQPTLYFKLSATSADWSAGLTWLPETSGPAFTVRAATTAAITIATDLNSGDTIDGVTLVAGECVLVKDQAAPEENGVYVAGASPSLTRSRPTINTRHARHRAGRRRQCRYAMAVRHRQRWHARNDSNRLPRSLHGADAARRDRELRYGGAGGLDQSRRRDGTSTVRSTIEMRGRAIRGWCRATISSCPTRRGTFGRIWANGGERSRWRDMPPARATVRPAAAIQAQQPDGIEAHAHSRNIFRRARSIGTTRWASTVLRQSSPVASWLEIARAAPGQRPINHYVCKQMKRLMDIWTYAPETGELLPETRGGRRARAAAITWWTTRSVGRFRRTRLRSRRQCRRKRFARCFIDGAWTEVEDHRGKTVYRTSERKDGGVTSLVGEEAVVTEIGPLPDDVTADKPGPHDRWNPQAASWVEDAALKRAATVPDRIRSRQLLIGLMTESVITESEAIEAARTGAVPAVIQAVFGKLPSAGERAAAAITWAKMSVVERDHPLVDALAAANGMSEADVDAFFQACAKI